ncbi:MAG: hypothetical protein IJ867_06485 [Clostridia bacterium]|nr:hypothetical protein [Clostridia bacterium]
MKKKIFRILLIVVLIAGMMIGLTACGDDDDEEETRSSRRKTVSAKANVDEDDAYEEDEGKVENSRKESKDKFSKTALKSSYEVERIYGMNADETKIVVAFKGEGATMFVTDLTGKVLNSFEVNHYGTEVKCGKWIENNGVVYDFDGKIWYKNDNSTKFLDVSESGYILRTRETESMATGKVKTYEIYDQKNDKVLKTLEGEIQYSGLADYFKLATKGYDGRLYLNENNFSVFNAKTEQEVVTTEVYKDYGEALRGFNFPFYDGEEMGHNKILSLEEGLVYTKYAKSLITDLDGNELKDISEGNPTRVEYVDGHFYVITETEYWYILDKDFNYVLEPEKMHNFFTGNNASSYFTKNGIFSLAKHDSPDFNYWINILSNDTLECLDLNSKEDTEVNYRLYRWTSRDAEELFNPVKANDYGICVNLQDGNAKVYINHKVYTFEDCEIQKYSNKLMIVNEKDNDYERTDNNYEVGKYNKNPKLINLETQEEIVFHK